MKTVLITGANRGIGFALTQEYLAAGYRVYATYRSEPSSHELMTLAVHHEQLSAHKLDITHYDEMAYLFDSFPTIDIVINNAGYYGPRNYGFGNTDLEEWRRVFEINTIAPLKLIEMLYPKLQPSSIRKIVCVSSKVGSMTENTSGGGYIYRSSKAALNSVVKSLSNDLSDDRFTVLALHPGWVKTQMGGPNALISTQTSAKGLFSVIESSTQKASGRFLNYDGHEIPW